MSGEIIEAIPEPPKKKRKKRRKWAGQKGGLRPLRKLTPEDVEKIWYLLNHSSFTQTEIAKQFNVGQEAISHINTGSRHNEITGLPRRTKASTTPPPSGSPFGRPRQSYLDSLKTKALKDDLMGLQDACIRAILDGFPTMYIRLANKFTIPAKFPELVLERTDGVDKIYIIDVKQLLTWLNKNKYSSYSVKDVIEMKRKVGIAIAVAERQYGIDLFDKEIYNDISPNK